MIASSLVASMHEVLLSWILAHPPKGRDGRLQHFKLPITPNGLTWVSVSKCRVFHVSGAGTDILEDLREYVIEGRADSHSGAAHLYPLTGRLSERRLSSSTSLK